MPPKYRKEKKNLIKLDKKTEQNCLFSSDTVVDAFSVRCMKSKEKKGIKIKLKKRMKSQ